MASYSYTYSGDLTTTLATKLYQTVRNAREDAKGEKVVAEKEAAKYGVEPELKRGEFFGQALKYRMTPGFLRGKKFGDQFNYPDYLARGQKSDDPLIGTPLASRVLPEYQQLANPLEQKYREKVKPKDPLVRPSTTYQDTVQRPVPTTDKKLGSLLVKIAETINKSISTIGERQEEVQSEISSAKDSSLAVARGLSVSTDTISDKLDDIANILNQQLALDKKIEDDKETDVVMQQVSDVDDLADTDAYAKLSDDYKLVAAQNEAEDVQRMRDNLLDTGDGPLDDIPQAETGGVFSGPDSGYPVMLHGNEMVIPLDNNYTQGEPSAVDGQVRPKPQYETGINNIVPTLPMVPKRKPMVSPTTKKTQTNDATTEDLIKVMEMPAKVAGLTTIAMMGRAASAMPVIPGMGGAIQSITQPIAETFGINNLVSNNLLKSVNTQQNSELNQTQNPPGLNLFDKIVNFFGGAGEFVSKIFNILNPFEDDEDDAGGGGYRAPGPPGGGGYNKMQPGGGLFDVFNTRPSGLARGTRGVRAGFTGMNSQGFNAMMQGQGYIPSNKPQILGKGAYSAPTFRGANRYAGVVGSIPGQFQKPGGVVNSIVPGNAPKLNIFEPQSKVSAGMFNKGRDLATKLQGGAYPNSTRANMLRAQITSGGVRTPVKTGVKPSHPLVMLAQMLIEDLISPQPVSAYDQVTGPNAMYNNPKLSEEQRRIMYESVHGPQNDTGTLLNVASSEALTSRRQNQMTPVVLNNLGTDKDRPQPEIAVSAIAAVGNSGTDTYTKSYTSPIFFD